MISEGLKNNIQQKYEFTSIEVKKRLGGLESLNYLIDTNKGVFVLKIKQKALGITEKIVRLNKFLDLHDINVPNIIKTTDNGSLYFTYKNKDVILYSFADGKTLHQGNFNKKAFNSVAQLAYRLHNLSDKCELNLDHSLDKLPSKKEILDNINFLKNGDNLVSKQNYELVNRLVDIKQRLVDRVLIKDYSRLFSGTNDLVHGDFHNENIIFDNNNNILVLLDFEEIHFGHRMEDLASFILFACCNTGFEEQNIKDAKRFLNLYLDKSLIKQEEIILGFHYSLYKSSNSFFIEKKLYETKNDFLVSLVRRDIKKFSYLKNNLEVFLQRLI